MEPENLPVHDLFQVIIKLFKKDYSYKAILHILREKYGLQISLRSLSRILRKFELRRKKIEESSLVIILFAIFVEINDTGANLGYKAIWKRLRKLYHLKVKQKTVMLLMRELDPDGVEARCRYRLKRRSYEAPGPNYVWHADNHDKLKRYGFPMYGFIDGFSRKVLCLKVSSSNNNPEVIAHHYVELVEKLECLPAILRTDKGTEANIMGDVQIALRMDHDDANSGVHSHIKGKSTNNQRIESYWRQFRQHLGQFYMDLFKSMEKEGMLNVDNKVHIECLRYCFGQVLTNYVNLTRKEWNEHQVRKQNGRNVTGGKPNEMYAWPEKFRKVDCRKPVNLNHVNLIKTDYTREPVLCSPIFLEFIDLLMPGTLIPSTNDEAFNLYQVILENILHYEQHD